MKPRFLVPGLVLAALLGDGNPARALPPRPPGNPAFWQIYLHGLDDLKAARWTEAIAKFDQATSLGPADPALTLARGAAKALAGQYAGARQDLDRVASREAKVWSYVVDKITGQTDPRRGIPIPRSLQKEHGEVAPDSVSIPGHLIQGGEDYSTAYASFIYYEMATPIAEARVARQPLDTRFFNDLRVRAGSWVANRQMARQEFATLHFERAQDHYEQKHFRAALQELEFARTHYPADPDLNHQVGRNWFRAGRPGAARRAYTRALIERTGFANAYIGRAAAAAVAGDRKRMEADLAAAATYDPQLTDTYRARIESGFKSFEPLKLPADPLELVRESDADLANITLRLHQTFGRTRVRYDELYQDTLRHLEEAASAAVGDPDPCLKLARYLIDEASNRGEQVEPGRGPLQFRDQFSKRGELDRALGWAEEALHRQPKYVPAIAVKALALHELGRSTEADALIRSVINPGRKNDPLALRLYAEFKFKRAGTQLMQAIGLRTPRYETSTRREWRSDGLWEITTTTRYEPSSADLARANDLQRTAAANLREAEIALREAVRLTRGTLTGYILEADFEQWFGSRSKAVAVLETAVRKYPDEIRAHDRLVEMYRFLLRKKDANRQETVGLRLVHTSSAPLLNLAWDEMHASRFPAAEALLMDCYRANPADARWAAYLGVLRDLENKPAEAARLYRLALAMETSRLNFDGSIDQTAGLPRPAGEFALAMEMRLRLGAAAEQAGDSSKALELYLANANTGALFPPGGVATPMFGALLPDPAAPEIPAPKAPNGAQLLSKSHLAAAKLLKAQGKEKEALVHLNAAAALGQGPNRMIPNIGDGKGDSNFGGFAGAPSAEAQLELAKALLQEGKLDEAFQYAQAATQNNPPKQLRDELNAVNLAIVRKLNERLGQKRAEEDNKRYEEVNRRRLEQERMAREGEASRRRGAPVDPALVGTWKGEGRNGPALVIEAKGTYELTESVAGQPPATSRGRIHAWNARMTLQPESGPARQAVFRLLANRSFDPLAPPQPELQVTFQVGQTFRLKKEK